MLLHELLDQLQEIQQTGAALNGQLRLQHAHSDSRRINAGDLFIALPGYRSQGVDYLAAALDAGARAALVPAECLASLPAALARYCIGVNHIHRNGAQAASALYGHPTRRLQCFGVTGTNGKTSTCHILKHLLEAAGRRVVMLTTVAHEFGDWREETPNTTPDAPLLQWVLRRALDAGADAAVLEVSAHGVWLERIAACRFDGLAFTNLSLDHQDFFAGIEPYFAQKQRLFTEARYHKPGCVAAIGTDDDYGRRLYHASHVPALSYGYHGAQVDASTLSLGADGIQGELRVGEAIFSVATNLNSSYNRLNLAAATTLAVAAGLPHDAIAQALQQPINVPGRLATVPSTAPFQVIVDFAHTDAAMDNLLSGLRAECTGRLIVVFGAGGDKDPARRRTLPQVVINRAEVGVITLDNPRSEVPEQIIATMVQNWHQLATSVAEPPQLFVEPDRRRAILCALHAARAGDIVVLAGKGHETTQIFADRIEYHDDYAVAAAWLDDHYPRHDAGRQPYHVPDPVHDPEHVAAGPPH